MSIPNSLSQWISPVRTTRAFGLASALTPIPNTRAQATAKASNLQFATSAQNGTGVWDDDNLGYTFGMKTAVSLPDDLFADAERIARRLKKPRSRLYSEAIREYVARHDLDLIAEKLNEVMRGLEPDDGFVATAGRKILERTDW